MGRKREGLGHGMDYRIIGVMGDSTRKFRQWTRTCQERIVRPVYVD